MYWRLHQAIFKEKLPSAISILESYSDKIQILNEQNGYIQPLDNDNANMPTLALTSILDAYQLDKNNGHCPLLFYHKHNYNMTHWISYYKDLPWLNKDATFTTVSLLEHNIQHIKSDKIFIRPNAGNKIFTGNVFYLNDWEYHYYNLTRATSPDTIIAVCDYQPLHDIEWRFWIIDGEVVCYSPYSWNQDIKWSQAPEDVINLAEQIAHHSYQIDVTYVVDIVTLSSDNTPFLNEINATSTSGVYDAPLDLLLPRLRHISHREFYYLTNNNYNGS